MRRRRFTDRTDRPVRRHPPVQASPILPPPLQVSSDVVKRPRGRPRKVRPVAEPSISPPIASAPVVDDCPVAPAPVQADTASGKIDKSALTISEPRRLRDKIHLEFVGSQPCLICGRSPADIAPNMSPHDIQLCKCLNKSYVRRANLAARLSHNSTRCVHRRGLPSARCAAAIVRS